MLQLLFDYFYELFYLEDGYNGTSLDDFSFEMGGHLIDFHSWFATTCAIISLILIIVVCVLFILKIVKVVGRLFTGA